jgi:hypothetical protein
LCSTVAACAAVAQELSNITPNYISAEISKQTICISLCLTQWYFCIFFNLCNFCLGAPWSSALAALSARDKQADRQKKISASGNTFIFHQKKMSFLRFLDAFHFFDEFFRRKKPPYGKKPHFLHFVFLLVLKMAVFSRVRVGCTKIKNWKSIQKKFVKKGYFVFNEQIVILFRNDFFTQKPVITNKQVRVHTVPSSVF